jgi:ATP-dependent exoDNAse (exonuclease V) beta subunit
MTAPSRSAPVFQDPVDAVARREAINARDRNLLVDAGAGTGKTALVVARLVEMVAPADDGPARDLTRIAAVTFTRRAAGELRFRIREKLLSALAMPDLSSTRRERLSAAVSALDTAFVGTIHGFADRLLRSHPVEARLSPSYLIEEDAEESMLAAYRILVEAAQSGRLADELVGTPVEELAAEASQTILDAITIRLRTKTEEFGDFQKTGLDLLVCGMLDKRDVPLTGVPAPCFDWAGFRAAVATLERRVSDLRGDGRGEKWFRATASLASELARGANDTPVEVASLLQRIEARTKAPLKKKQFSDAATGWALWKDFHEKQEDGLQLARQLASPLRAWIAHCLARLGPVAEALYARLKARRGVVDTIDLLLVLRNVLQDDLAVRAALQARFDHIFVDEFQDTDPLQAEVLLYLCEKEPRAAQWQDVVIGEGRITVVGDPKQSIYRFRRADIALYQAVRAQIARDPKHLAIRLEACFRAVPRLIEYGNRCFADVLGVSPTGSDFDPATGTVFHQPLAAGRPDDREECVHVVPYLHADGEAANVGPARRLEGEALAHYLRWLVDRSKLTISDPLTKTPRPVRYSDVAVLALVTTNLPFLLSALDRASVPYAAAGGRLFVEDPLHQQFILGLRALADREDGVAVAALLRPPFFAVELGDVVVEHLARRSTNDEAPTAEPGRTAVREALAWVQEARRLRGARSAGATARALLEETAFARCVALGPNAELRLSHLRELCTRIDHLARIQSLDFDGVTALVRGWIDDPVQLDPPRPVATDAVQVLTVHQAKGLEFPVVVLWDGMGKVSVPDRVPVWTNDRVSGAWAIEMTGLKWEEPRTSALVDRNAEFAKAERRRLIYVAATRARDLLVLPKPVVKDPTAYIVSRLITAGGGDGVRVLEPWREDTGATWAAGLVDKRGAGPRLEEDADAAAEISKHWTSAEAEARRAHFRPVGVGTVAHATAVTATEPDGEAPAPKKERVGRFGPTFGTTVHGAIADVVERGTIAAEAVKRAGRAAGLDEARWADALADVERTVAALKAEGLIGRDGVTTRLEYPISVGAVVGGEGAIVAGYVDFVAASDTEIVVIDFKTDAAPAGDVRSAYPGYVEQVKSYARVVAPDAPRVRLALAFTQTGKLEWV